MSTNFRIIYVWLSLLAPGACTHAQTPPVPYRPRPRVAVVTPPVGAKPTAPSDLSAYLSSRRVDLIWSASTASAAHTITTYKIQRCEGPGCTAFTQIGTSTKNNYIDKDVQPQTGYIYRIIATDDTSTDSDPSGAFPVTTTLITCYLLPTRPGCMDFGTGKNTNINAFYDTNGSLSFFNQLKSIYNGASGSATVSADLATLNFSNGMQVTASTNVQAGPTGSTNAGSGSVPTLSSNGAGQATQNVLYGGTVVGSELYPLLAVGGSKIVSAGGFGLLVDFIAKEGVDIQNFKSGTNANVSSPPFHGSAQIEGYLQYNSINLDPKSKNFQGAIFFGGAYGYNYMSHRYARDYGFASNVNNGIGQVSVGLLINGVARISVSRAFGPSQTYIDSTTTAQTNVNNFKAWSFGIAYQSAATTK